MLLDLWFQSSEVPMANNLAMSKVNGILDLYRDGWSQRRIAQVLGVDRKTVAARVAEEASKRAIAPTGQAPIGSEPGPRIGERGKDAVPPGALPPRQPGRRPAALRTEERSSRRARRLRRRAAPAIPGGRSSRPSWSKA